MSDPNKTPSNTDDEAERQREKARIDAAKRNLNLNPSKDSGVGQSLAVPGTDKDTRSSSQFIQSKPSTSKKARLDHQMQLALKHATTFKPTPADDAGPYEPTTKKVEEALTAARVIAARLNQSCQSEKLVRNEAHKMKGTINCLST